MLRLTNLAGQKRVERLKLKIDLLKTKLTDVNNIMTNLPMAQIIAPDPLIRATEPIMCRICAPHDPSPNKIDSMVAPNGLRSHMAFHMQFHREYVQQETPCGFCLVSDENECSIQLERSSNMYRASVVCKNGHGHGQEGTCLG